MGVSKVTLNGDTLIDVTGTTATSGTTLSGYGGTGADGNTYSGSIATKSSSNMTVSGATVTAPAGYYASNASKSVASGSATTPATTITSNPSISVNSTTGLITASVSKTQSVTPTVSAGYVSSGTAGTITVSGSNTSQLSTQAGTTITPTTSQQTAVAAGKYTLGDVKVAAMTSGTAGTPTATKGTVSNHSVSVTPSVINTTGYITGSTKTGTAVTVSASELVSGTKTISSPGTGIDVTNYAEVDVLSDSSKMDKVTGATTGDVAVFDSSGQVVDSGKKFTPGDIGAVSVSGASNGNTGSLSTDYSSGTPQRVRIRATVAGTGGGDYSLIATDKGVLLWDWTASESVWSSDQTDVIHKLNKTVEGTTNGTVPYISLGLNSNYGVLSIRDTRGTHIALPYWSVASSGWYATVFSNTLTPATGTQVTLDVDYYAK